MSNDDEISMNIDSVDRDSLIQLTANAVVRVQHKAINGRFKDDKKENIRIQYWKTLNSLIKTLANLVSDKELDMLHDEIKSLKFSSDAVVDSDNSVLEKNVDEINEIDERIKELQRKKFD